MTFNNNLMFIKCLLAIIGSLTLIFVFLSDYHIDGTINYIRVSHVAKTTMKYILHYNDFWGMKLCINDGFKHCPVSKCMSTENHSLLPIEQFDAIIFNDPTSDGITIPRRRRLFQKYIFLSLESPVSYGIRHSNNFYNWTISYRADADIYYPFGKSHYSKSNFSITIDKIKRKTKLIAWVTSNCQTSGAQLRINYVHELKKYIPVDIYGRCGNLTCPGRMSMDCYNLLDKSYKFYLSFENSLCKEYITEKLFHVLNFTNMIPIVLGFGNYKAVAPPYSYINIEDFDSPKRLAAYLIDLAHNIDEYARYFQWKNDYYVQTDTTENMCCELCRKLHEPLQYSWYENLNDWAWSKNKSICKIPDR